MQGRGASGEEVRNYEGENVERCDRTGVEARRPAAKRPARSGDRPKREWETGWSDALAEPVAPDVRMVVVRTRSIRMRAGCAWIAQPSSSGRASIRVRTVERSSGGTRCQVMGVPCCIQRI